ncbi:MAG: sigma 54-interacting transcriptional regulator, partial [Thermodesulfobacteriota bacterium]|nr:sigma 54-interacting transcriptional regulator [Thermodesulfobacteriota bacterium]
LCMMKTVRLSPEDIDFFRLVAQAAVCNPFGDDRGAMDLKIAQCSEAVSVEQRMERVKTRVRERVSRLQRDGRADIRRYHGEERTVMRSAFLFNAFHCFSKQFDQLILDQIETGDTPCVVTFARDALAMLAGHGFTAAEADRFLAILYQLHRAYFFIDQELIGQSRSMKGLRLHLWNNVFTHDIVLYERYLWNRMEDFSTFLLGETGTGKGTAAASIGRSGFIPYDRKKGRFSESFTRNFISVNLSLYPESLIESELFGHKKGAFTGAIEQHQGIFARCTPHGAIFLDEIGDVSVPVQVKLLQILQDRTFSPVGSHENIRFNGRVIAATNRPLDALRRKGHFRNDFYYRLCSDCIVVPPFRQRLQEDPKELDAMLMHVIKRLIGEASPELVQMAREGLRANLGPDYPWPGNVRELEQGVRRVLLTKEYQGDYSATASDVKGRLLSGLESGSLDAQELLSGYCSMLYERFGNYQEVSRRMKLDRRTVKRYVELSKGAEPKLSPPRCR